MNGFVIFIGALWSLFCFLAGGFTFSPSFREAVMLKIGNMRSNRKVKVEASEAWKQDIGLHPRRSEVSAAAPTVVPSAIPRRGDPSPDLRGQGAPASGPPREPQPAPEPEAATPAPTYDNGHMSVEEAKAFLKKRGFNVKKKRKPQAP